MDLSQFPVYSVIQINQYIKNSMDRDELLSGLLVRGEVSNYKCYPSGHHYFSLKDAQSSIRCVMFRGDASRLRFRPENGMSVVAFGSISVFPRDGQYQLYCKELIDDGRGALDRAFEELRLKLEKEGLFSPDSKQKLPKFPNKVALVTSPVGAAVRDMIRILEARWPMAEVLVVPTRVQGDGAAEEIADAINSLNNRDDVDLIITGRGGGSREDLWSFNEEIVARAIFVSNIPVVSAVGHEPDVSISDYVADVRASTPSNAAELAVPDQDELKKHIQNFACRLAATERNRIIVARRKLDLLRSNRMLRDMRAPINERRVLLDSLEQRLVLALKSEIKDARSKLGEMCAKLSALNPLQILARGYAVAKGDDGVIRSARNCSPGELVDVILSDGILHCRIEDKEDKTWL